MSWEIKKLGEDRYLSYLRRISDDAAEFSRFRRNKDIRGIIDGVTPSAARGYLKRIDDLAPDWIESHCSELRRNEEVGDPELTVFGRGIELAPVTLRYAWNALEMDRALSLAGKTVVEIGGGYGGLARIVCALFRPARYYIIDLPEARTVAERYLSHFHPLPLTLPIEFLPLDASIESDIFVANYSVAEFDRLEQRRYLDNIILRARSGYLTHNIPNPSKRQLSRQDFEAELRTKFDVSSYEEGLERSEKSRVYVCRAQSESQSA